MSRRKKNADRSTSPPAAARFSLRGLLLAALAALFIARPLLPSENSVTADGEGLAFVLLMLLLVAFWALAGFFRGELRVRLSWADAAWAALLVCMAAGTWRTVHAGAARPAINLFWEWTALGAGFFLVRQLIANAREARALTAVMLALAVTLSAYGLHEYFVSMPNDRAQYRENPEKMLRELNLPVEPDSPQRIVFEKRLESTEPMATFALTNSLAGVLAPWWIVAMGLALSNRRSAFARSAAAPYNRSAMTLTGLLAAIGVILACLLLTKSRSAWLASAAGLGVLGLAALRHGGLINRRIVLAGAALLAALVGGAVATGSLDREILTEASKSLGYRWQYWQASLAMIKDRPWLGCGLGNFQDEYTRYKLPDASEVVADPHNLLFEVWATAGTPALAAFLAIFVGVGYDLFRRRRSKLAAADIDAVSDNAAGASLRPDKVASASDGWFEPAAANWALVLAAALPAGFGLAFFIGLSSTVSLSVYAVLGGLAVSAIVLGLLTPWVHDGALPGGLPLLGSGVLTINLLAAGGISFPGVAASLWLLLALGLNLTGADAPGHALKGRSVALTACAAAALIGAFSWSDYLPVMQSRLLLLQSESALGASREELLQSAAEADPRWSRPWEALEAIELSRWRGRHDRTAFKRWERAIEELNQRRPHSAAARLHAGNAHLDAYQAAHQEHDLLAAISNYQQAVRLYPNHAENHARLAVALAAAGKLPEARRAAAETLRLDDLTPHEDQKLSEELRSSVERLR